MRAYADGRRNRGGIDYFRIAAALLVIANHTSPFGCFGEAIDFLLTGIIARIAVPFFLMVTGYFVLPQYVFEKASDSGGIRKFMKKAIALYAASAMLYLPIGLYAGYYDSMSFGKLARLVIFDGTFYHLWYLPASILGAAILYVLGQALPERKKEPASTMRAASLHVAVICVCLYIIGLAGDSYYGLFSRIPFLSALYEAGFCLFTYTRNGLFLTPVFLLLGAWFGHTGWRCSRTTAAAGFLFSMSAMLGEGLLVKHFAIARHNSMYIALLPCAFFVFSLLLTWDIRPSKHLRDISMYLYILHPMAIIAVRGAAKAAGMTKFLEERSLVRYLAVCGLSWLLSEAVVFIQKKGAKKDFCRGRA